MLAACCPTEKTRWRSKFGGAGCAADALRRGVALTGNGSGSERREHATPRGTSESKNHAPAKPRRPLGRGPRELRWLALCCATPRGRMTKEFESITLQTSIKRGRTASLIGILLLTTACNSEPGSA